MTPDRPSPPALLWTAEEVAFSTALSEDAIDRERKAGRLAAVRVGRAYRYHPDDVQAWIRSLRPVDANRGKPYAFDPEELRTPQAGTRAG